MLPERYCALLTAYVDGVLSSRRRKLVHKLLHRSAGARELFKQLKENRRTIKSLPRHELGAQFTGQVVQVAFAPPAPVVAGPVAPNRRVLRNWVGVAVAAAVLLLVAGGSYVFFTAFQGSEDQSSGPLVQNPQKPGQPDPMVARLVEDTLRKFQEPIGARFALLDLNEEKAQSRLTRELQKDNAFHLDVTVRDSARSVEWLERALRAQRIKMVLDASTQEALKHATPNTEFLVYAENLRLEELVKVLKQLGDRKTPANSPFDEVLLTSIHRQHREHLAGMLGLKGADLAAPPLALQDPISAKNAKNDRQTSGNKKSDAAAEERFALVLVNMPQAGSTAALSEEVQEFLRQRRDQRPGTMQVLFLLRQG